MKVTSERRKVKKWNAKGKAAMTTAEISEELGLTEDAVRDLLKKAMKKLRDGRAEIFRELVEELERLQKSEEHKLIELPPGRAEYYRDVDE